MQVGSLVTRLEATDADAGHNAELEYGIASGHDGSLFDIDPMTGVITVGQGLDADRLFTVQQIRLVVIVKDKGLPPLQTVADLFIMINDTSNAVETARLGGNVAEQADESISVAIIAAVGVAAGGTLVIICIIIVAITVCFVKRNKQQRQQQRNKQENSR